MDVIWRWGLDLIIALQQLGAPWVTALFKAITFMGEEEFYLLVLPILLWSVNFRMAAGLGVVFLLSVFLNGGLKEVLQHPRPFDLDPSVQLASAEGYGLPSGHAQLPLIVWIGIAAWARKRWVWTAAVTFTVLIGVSRVYLGVHFPTDVLGGWLLGGGSLVLYLWIRPSLEAGLGRRGFAAQIVFAAAVPLGLIAVYPSTSALGALAGVGIGLALATRYLDFNARGGWGQHLARYAVGMPAVLALHQGLKAVFPAEGEALYALFRFLRYALVGFWIAFGAPWVFKRLRLAGEEPAPVQAADAPAMP